MVATLRALGASPYMQALGLALLSLIFAAVRVATPDQPPHLFRLLAGGAMLAAFIRVAIHRAPSRWRGLLIGVAAYLLLGLLYGSLRYVITQERAFLITTATFWWPWIVVWDAGCLLGVWHCVSLGN